jgi:two-component system chemotaxis sensor kinase CheA
MFREAFDMPVEDASTKKKILLAEDDGSMRRFVEIILQKADYEVVSAEDGLTAMKSALSEQFDAVVADAVMPNLTGHDLCRILRQNPQTKEIPFVILSGLEQNDLDENYLADAYLLKGTNLKDDLLNTLSRLLSKTVTT